MHPRVCRREFFVYKTINRTRDNYLKELSFLSNLSLFVVNSLPKNSRAFYVYSSTLKNLNKLNTHRKTRLKNTNTTFDFKDLRYNSRPEINLLFRFITVDEHWPVNNYWSRPVLTNIRGIVPVVGWNSNQCQPYIRSP